jgi:hypothetical protein
MNVWHAVRILGKDAAPVTFADSLTRGKEWHVIELTNHKHILKMESLRNNFCYRTGNC